MQMPFYIKRSDGEPLPDEPVSYTISRDGLYMNRSTPLFKSSVPCRNPRDFARHEATLEWNRPIPRHVAEQAVGFFHAVNCRSPGAEAILLLGWSPENGYEAIVPEQRAVVALHAFGRRSPLRVSYEVPAMRAGVVVAGSIHSHACIEAFSSDTDDWDTRNRAGLHITVGRIDLPVEPPDLYAIVIVDRFTFIIENPLALFAGYTRRSTDIPENWLARVKVEEVLLRRPAGKPGARESRRQPVNHEN